MRGGDSDSKTTKKLEKLAVQNKKGFIKQFTIVRRIGIG